MTQRDGSGDGRRIIISSDPGRTSWFVRRILDEETRQWAGDHEVVHRQVLLPLRKDSTLDVDQVQQWARDDGGDYTVVVTEVPRVGEHGPKSAELHFSENLAILSLPTLGPVGVRHALRREFDRAVTTLEHGSVAGAQGARLGWRLEGDDEGESVYITPRFTLPARAWQTLGMVSANEPLRALPKLSGAFAAASATGVFVVFSDTSWGLIDAMSRPRLLGFAALAVLVMVGWLMLRNKLWDRPADVGGARLAVVYNLSTVLSLLLSVAVMLGLLFIGMIIIAWALIEPWFMAQSTPMDGGWADFATLAWLAAAMGTAAGAIGSNFDQEANLAHLTQGSRELQRYPRDAEQR